LFQTDNADTFLYILPHTRFKVHLMLKNILLNCDVQQSMKFMKFENCNVPGYYTVSSGNCLQTFGTDDQSHLQGSRIHFLILHLLNTQDALIQKLQEEVRVGRMQSKTAGGQSR